MARCRSVGSVIKQPDLAATLEAIASQGAKGFYEGRVAADLVDGVRAGGGIWTLADLKAYRVVERKPLVGKYHGARIVSAPPPSSGGIAVIDSLNILSGFDLHGVDSATRKHLVIEAMRRAYRDRAMYLGDPDFVKMPLAQLLSSRTTPPASAPASAPTRPCRSTCCRASRSRARRACNTTHFSVLDAAGNRVGGDHLGQSFLRHRLHAGQAPACCSTTPWMIFRPSRATPNAFGLVGDAANAIAPNKRSLSSMAPTFVETPKGMMIIGSPGRQLHHQHGAAGHARTIWTA